MLKRYRYYKTTNYFIHFLYWNLVPWKMFFYVNCLSIYFVHIYLFPFFCQLLDITPHTHTFLSLFHFSLFYINGNIIHFILCVFLLWKMLWAKGIFRKKNAITCPTSINCTAALSIEMLSWYHPLRFFLLCKNA